MYHDAVQVVVHRSPPVRLLAAGERVAGTSLCLIALQVHRLHRRTLEAEGDAALELRHLRQVWLHVQLLGEGDAVGDFDAAHGGVVEVEALQLQRQHVRKVRDLEPLFRVHHHLLWPPFLWLRVQLVLVVAFERLRLDESFEALFHRGDRDRITELLDRKRHVHELLALLRLKLNRTPWEVADVAFEVALEEVLDQRLLRRAFHPLLQLVEQHPTELLHVVLLESFARVPPEALCEVLGLDGSLVRQLHLSKEILELEADAILLLVRVVDDRDLIHAHAELRRHVQALQQRVHVTGRTLV
mmetsp:Transcript_36164/g.84972  ORF Transcript_36164/g.84972 Transcript_36164/m.84972 type:complete len:300 (-) Transcript_36164:911-1810(-)